MKSLKLFVILVLFTFFGFAQNCIPINNSSFKKVEKYFKKAKSDERRMLLGESQMLGHCISANQFTLILDHFDSDLGRAEFLKAYFHSISDFHNFQIAFNSFDKISNALNCYESIRPQVLLTISSSKSNKTQEMNQTDFKGRFELVKLEQYARDKKERIRVLFRDAALSFQQVDQIVEQFIYARDKQWALKLLYENCTEKEEYYKFATIFDYSREREEFLSTLD